MKHPLTKEENSLIKKELTRHLGREPFQKDFKKVTTTITEGNSQYYYLLYDKRILGRVDKVKGKVTFKPSGK